MLPTSGPHSSRSRTWKTLDFRNISAFVGNWKPVPQLSSTLSSLVVLNEGSAKNRRINRNVEITAKIPNIPQNIAVIFVQYGTS